MIEDETSVSLSAVLQVEQEMAENGRVHPGCINASNPYHECGVACLEKIAQGKGRKEKKKSDYRYGVKEGELSKKMDGERRAHCSKASNPYHNCDEYCSNKKGSGSFILDAALGFGRKKKESESQRQSPNVANYSPTVKAVYPADIQSPPLPIPKKKLESDTSQSFSSSQQHSDQSYSRDYSFEKGLVRAVESVPTSGNVTPDGAKSPSKGLVQASESVPTYGNVMPDGAKSPSKVSLSCYAIATPTEKEQNEKLLVSPKAASHPFINNLGNVSPRPNVKSMNFNYSGISCAEEESDEEETRSVISDSCVAVGKYHVRPNIASILQLIFDKYGDIAASSRLESASMRAYYLESLCFVVQELQSISFKQLTKSKVKEMSAVLKDVESAQIDVRWLRGILDELVEVMELSSQLQAAEAAKGNCDNDIELTRKELEPMLEDLAQKEKAVADAKAKIAEARASLRELELESSRLGDTMSSIWSRVEKFHSKPLADEIL